MTDAPLDDLFDDIHNAMLDVHDMDSGLGHYAQAVVNSLRNASPAAFAELGPVRH